MARPRRYTEHLGFQATLEESRVFKEYLKSRGMSASQYFRELVVKPLLAAQQAEGEAKDGHEAA
jgi:hypothetical protein